jgi:hypothetical protein
MENLGRSHKAERWTLVGYEHVGGGIRNIEGRALDAGERVEVVPASQLEGAVAENRKLRALIEAHPGTAAGSRCYDWACEAGAWLTDHPGGQ